MQAVPVGKYAEGQRVDVKVLRQGKPPDWIPGTILDRQRGRALVRLDRDGEEKTFCYYELRPRSADAEAPRISTPLSTIGDGARIAPAIQFAASNLSPYLDHDQGPKAKEPESGVMLRAVRQEEEVRTVTRVPERKPRERREHFPTEIGNVFRRFRKLKDQTQPDFALLLESQAWRLSRIESGDMVPSDDELIAFAQMSGQDLEKLERLRDQGDSEIRERKFAAERARTHRAEPAAPEPTPAATATASATTTLVSATAPTLPAPSVPAAQPMPSAALPAPAPSAGTDPDLEFFEFCEWLRAGVPIPTSGDDRKLWLAMAKRFFEFRPTAAHQV